MRAQGSNRPTDEYFNAALGRWLVRGDGSWPYRYRWIMEQHLGRPLSSDEHVHHRNGDRTDDRLENLQLLSPTEHATLHSADRIAGRMANWLYEWSAKHPACVECGTTERQHEGKGLCGRCYFRLRKRREGGHQPRCPATTITATCPRCGDDFTRSRSAGVRKYCSAVCAAEGRAARRKPSRLTPDQLEAIRQSSASGAELAQRFGVSQQHICNIRKGRVLVGEVRHAC